MDLNVTALGLTLLLTLLSNSITFYALSLTLLLLLSLTDGSWRSAAHCQQDDVSCQWDFGTESHAQNRQDTNFITWPKRNLLLITSLSLYLSLSIPYSLHISAGITTNSTWYERSSSPETLPSDM